MNREEELLSQAAGRQLHRVEEFRFDAFQNAYWDILTGFVYRDPKSVNALVPLEYWPMKIVKDPATGEEKQVLIKPATYLANVSNGLLVETSTWWPGRPRIIEGWLAVEGAMLQEDRRVMFNTYRPPPSLPAVDRAPKKRRRKKKKQDAPDQPQEEREAADPWINHIKELWPTPEEYNYFFDYCAHMVQRPEEKCNAIVTLSGEQGIGKDVALIPVKKAVGTWNVRDISPDDFASPHNPWVECVMLIINEMRPSKEDFHASSIYEKLKRISVTPPDTISLSDKYMKMRYVMNVLRIFVTTNDMTAMYINPNDRRFAIFHSPKRQGWQDAAYFTNLVNWLEREGGNLAVARWLFARDISAFEPKRKPDPTAGWRAIVSGWGAPDDAVGQAIERLRSPLAFFAPELYASDNFDGKDEILGMLRHPRKMTHRMQASNYFVVPFSPPLEFRGRENGKVIKFKTAFVKYELMHEKEQFMALLNERGQLLADDVAIIGQAAPPARSQGAF